jgi:hypothetical protein
MRHSTTVRSTVPLTAHDGAFVSPDDLNPRRQ